MYIFIVNATYNDIQYITPYAFALKVMMDSVDFFLMFSVHVIVVTWAFPEMNVSNSQPRG